MKRTAAAALRNADAILAVLREVLPTSGRVLEIGSGTGEHAIRFAAAFPALDWQPSDPDPEARASVAAWAADARLPNLRAPLALDLLAPRWRTERADAMLVLNVLHAAPAECAAALARGAPAVLPPGGPLVVYGPFWTAGPSSAAVERLLRIDGKLRAFDPAYGVRNRDGFVALLGDHGLALSLERTMAAPDEGDRILVFRRGIP